MSELVGLADTAVRERLSEGAYRHSVRVAQTSASLALLYAADEDSAYVAGLLHDWDREIDDAALVAAAAKSGLARTAADDAVPYLLHARTGAASVAEAIPGVSDEIAEAVAAHTLGSPGMGELAMIVYVADMIEPSRDFEGVDAIREAAGNVGLDELFALAYRHSVMHLVEERKWIHPQTVAVWNAYVARRTR